MFIVQNSLFTRYRDAQLFEPSHRDERWRLNKQNTTRVVSDSIVS